MITKWRAIKWIIVWKLIYPKNFSFDQIVLHPTNVNLHLQLALKFAERNFERPIIKGISHIEHMNFQIDPKQLSDLLDFVKFHNYSVFYGNCLFDHSFYCSN